VLAELITSHAFDRHIRACRLRYRRRRDMLLARLGPLSGQRLPGFAIQGIAAGLHALISLPRGGLGEQDLLSLAHTNGLALDGLSGHWHDQGDHPQGVIVGYATPSESAYLAALNALIDVFLQASRAPRPAAG